jgi:ABC-2 type transport system permease protein
LIDKKISVIIEIPRGFYAETLAGNQAEVIITSLEDYENSAFVEAYINSYMSSISILSAGANGNHELFDQLLSQYDQQEIEITRTAAMLVDKEKITGEGGFINSIGFFLMFIFSISVFVAFMVLEDRFSGVYSRIQVTPVKPIQYIFGTGIFGIVLCMIQIGLFSMYIDILDVETGIPIGIIILMMTLFSLFTICFSLSISLALKSKNAITSIIIGFSTIGCILGGAYFSLDMAPKSLQNLARILPQYWFMDAFRRIQADVHANIYPNIIIMSLFIILSFLVGAVLFSQNYKNS